MSFMVRATDLEQASWYCGPLPFRSPTANTTSSASRSQLEDLEWPSCKRQLDKSLKDDRSTELPPLESRADVPQERKERTAFVSKTQG